MSIGRALPIPIQLVSTVLLSTGFLLAQPQYKVMDLGVPGTFSFGASGGPTDINNSGQVIVNYGDGGSLLWQNGSITDLAKPGGVRAINSSGAIVGGTWLWQNGELTNLGDFGIRGGALGINDRLQVVGQYSDGDLARHAVLWEQGNLIYLPGLGYRYYFSIARAINNAGMIAGSVYEWDSANSSQAVVWKIGPHNEVTVTNIGAVLSKEVSGAWGVNSRGQVVGEFWDIAWNIRDGFLWDRGSVTVLPGLRARAINARGQVVGFIGNRAALWESDGKGNGHIIDLGTLGTGESAATAINDAGEIVGWYRTTAGETRSFIATRQ